MDRKARIHQIRSNVPQELLQLAQWVCWRIEVRDDKPTKVPYSITGSKAASDKPSTWSAFELAAKAFIGGNYNGVGFMFSEHDPYIGIDFDKCAGTDGEIKPKILHMVDLLDSYTEWSQSSSGLHVIVRGTLPPGGRKSNQHQIEMYDRLRFFVVTGDRLGGFPATVNERQAQIEQFHEAIFPAKTPTPSPMPGHRVAGDIPSDDQELQERMFASKNGADIQALWRGDRSRYNNDESSADLALCNHLAFWTGNDSARIDRMFRQSRLYRDKWDRNARTGETYGAGTISRAIAATLETYTPRVYTNGHKPMPEDETPKTETAKPEPDNFFLQQSADDEGNAQCVNKVHGEHFLYCDAYGWMQNTGTHWIYGGLAEKEINLAITQTLIERRITAVKTENERIIKATKPSSSNKTNVKSQFKDIVWCDVGLFDQEKHLLNCRNGIVDLRTGQMVTSESSTYFTYCVNAEYHPQLNTQEWITFLATTIGDYESIDAWLQMACGYSITGYTNEEIMFYNYGPTRSGKGTFMNTYLHMLGQPLGLGINFSTFTAKREGDSQNFDLAPLKPSRFISASESGRHQALNEAVIKQITGNDPIRASFKGKDHFTFFPQFKIWLSSNHPVKGDVDDDAFWGRVKVIDFPNSHLGEEDKSLKEHMQSPSYCNMVLTYSVLGAQKWHASPKGMITPDSVRKSVAEQRSQLDNVQRWLDECTKRIEEVSTPNDALRKSYEEWCRQNGEAPKFAVQFGKAMNAKGYESTNVKDHGMSKRGYRNIALLAPEPVDSRNDRPPSMHWDG